MDSLKRFALVGGHLFDGTGAPARPGATVLIEGDRISAVAKSGNVSLPQGTTVIDTRGKMVMPGLIDAHIHLTFLGFDDPELGSDFTDPYANLALVRALRNTLDAGVTTLRDVGSHGHVAFRVRKALRAGYITGPRLVLAGNILAMTSPGAIRFQGMYREADGLHEVFKAVREQWRSGADCIKVMSTGAVTVPEEDPTFAQYTFDEMTTIVREAHRLGLTVCAHAEGLDGIRVAIAAGVDTLEHGDELYQDPALLDKMRDTGIILVPTLALFESLAEHPEVAHACDHVRDRARELRQQHLRSFRLALERGVTIAMGSDAADPYNRHGCNVRELALMVEAGMSPAAALVAATQNAAQACGLAEELGTVEPGKRADILVVDGDPLKDITCLQRREAVWLVVQAGNPVAGSALAPQIPMLNPKDQGGPR